MPRFNVFNPFRSTFRGSQQPRTQVAGHHGYDVPGGDARYQTNRRNVLTKKPDIHLEGERMYAPPVGHPPRPVEEWPDEDSDGETYSSTTTDNYEESMHGHRSPHHARHPRDAPYVHDASHQNEAGTYNGKSASHFPAPPHAQDSIRHGGHGGPAYHGHPDIQDRTALLDPGAHPPMAHRDQRDPHASRLREVFSDAGSQYSRYPREASNVSRTSRHGSMNRSQDRPTRQDEPYRPLPSQPLHHTPLQRDIPRPFPVPTPHPSAIHKMPEGLGLNREFHGLPADGHASPPLDSWGPGEDLSAGNLGPSELHHLGHPQGPGPRPQATDSNRPVGPHDTEEIGSRAFPTSAGFAPPTPDRRSLREGPSAGNLGLSELLHPQGPGSRSQAMEFNRPAGSHDTEEIGSRAFPTPTGFAPPTPDRRSFREGPSAGDLGLSELLHSGHPQGPGPRPQATEYNRPAGSHDTEEIGSRAFPTPTGFTPPTPDRRSFREDLSAGLGPSEPHHPGRPHGPGPRPQATEFNRPARPHNTEEIRHRSFPIPAGFAPPPTIHSQHTVPRDHGGRPDEWPGDHRRPHREHREHREYRERREHREHHVPHERGEHREHRHEGRRTNRDLQAYKEADGYTHYVIPAGANVIFQDQVGNEITRVGTFPYRRESIVPSSGRHVPMIVRDEYGRELFRSDGSAPRHSKRQPNVMHIDPRQAYHRERGPEWHSPSYSRSTPVIPGRYDAGYSRPSGPPVVVDPNGHPIPWDSRGHPSSGRHRRHSPDHGERSRHRSEH